MNNGKVINEPKLQFCQDEVEFTGLNVTNDGVTPSRSILTAISDFKIPTDITKAHSWFGLVNQVLWSYAISPIMEPFRHLNKPNQTFHWDDNLKNMFNASKLELIQKVKDEVKSFEPGRHTCLQTDRCKHGIGYLLLQKHCLCLNTMSAAARGMENRVCRLQVHQRFRG